MRSDALSLWESVSASCERVFALLKHMFGDLQMSSLSDYVQAALMPHSNGRKIG